MLGTFITPNANEEAAFYLYDVHIQPHKHTDETDFTPQLLMWKGIMTVTVSGRSCTGDIFYIYSQR